MMRNEPPAPEKPLKLEPCDSPTLPQKMEHDESSIANPHNRSQSDMSSLLAYQASFIRDEEDSACKEETPKGGISSPMRKRLFALQECEIQEEEESSYEAGSRQAEDSNFRSLAEMSMRGGAVSESFCFEPSTHEPEGSARKREMQAVISRIKNDRVRMGVQVNPEEIEAKKEATLKALERMCLKESLLQNMKNIDERMEARRKRRAEMALENKLLQHELLFNTAPSQRSSLNSTAGRLRRELEAEQWEIGHGTPGPNYL